MNDAERELRQLLFEKAGEPTTSVRPPDRVLQRSRLRQLRTVAGGILASIAVVGLVAVQIGRQDSSAPADRPTATDRTVWIEGVRISAPASAYLIDLWGAGFKVPDDRGLPVLQLTNWDPGLDQMVCGGSIPSHGAVLYVGMAPPPQPISLLFGATLEATTPIADGPCGPGRYLLFAPGDRTLMAWIALGPNADPAIAQGMFDAFSSMRVDPWPDDTTSFTEPAYVIAGEAGADPAHAGWRLEVLVGGRTSNSPSTHSTAEASQTSTSRRPSALSGVARTESVPRATPSSEQSRRTYRACGGSRSAMRTRPRTPRSCRCPRARRSTSMCSSPRTRRGWVVMWSSSARTKRRRPS